MSSMMDRMRRLSTLPSAVIARRQAQLSQNSTAASSLDSEEVLRKENVTIRRINILRQHVEMVPNTSPASLLPVRTVIVMTVDSLVSLTPATVEALTNPLHQNVIVVPDVVVHAVDECIKYCHAAIDAETLQAAESDRFVAMHAKIALVKLRNLLRWLNTTLPDSDESITKPSSSHDFRNLSETDLTSWLQFHAEKPSSSEPLDRTESEIKKFRRGGLAVLTRRCSSSLPKTWMSSDVEALDVASQRVDDAMFRALQLIAQERPQEKAPQTSFTGPVTLESLRSCCRSVTSSSAPTGNTEDAESINVVQRAVSRTKRLDWLASVATFALKLHYSVWLANQDAACSGVGVQVAVVGCSDELRKLVRKAEQILDYSDGGTPSLLVVNSLAQLVQGGASAASLRKRPRDSDVVENVELAFFEDTRGDSKLASE